MSLISFVSIFVILAFLTAVARPRMSAGMMASLASIIVLLPTWIFLIAHMIAAPLRRVARLPLPQQAALERLMHASALGVLVYLAWQDLQPTGWQVLALYTTFYITVPFFLSRLASWIERRAGIAMFAYLAGVFRYLQLMQWEDLSKRPQ